MPFETFTKQFGIPWISFTTDIWRSLDAVVLPTSTLCCSHIFCWSGLLSQWDGRNNTLKSIISFWEIVCWNFLFRASYEEQIKAIKIKSLSKNIDIGSAWIAFYPRHPSIWWIGVWTPKHFYEKVFRVSKHLLITWRIIPVSKWLITMISKSPSMGQIPFPNGHSFHASNEHHPGCLGHIGDEILPSYIGIYRDYNKPL